MQIGTEVRTLEAHVKAMAPLSKSAQIAIISKAQGMLIGDERNIAVLAIVKNRIIRSK